MKQKITVYLVVEKGKPVTIYDLLIYKTRKFAEDVCASFNRDGKNEYMIKKAVLVV